MLDDKEEIPTTNENPFTLNGFLIFMFVIWSLFLSILLMVELWNAVF